MRNIITRIGLATVIGTCLTAAETQGGAGSHLRRSPIVEAVQKTRDSIVVIKVERISPDGGIKLDGTGVIVDERGYIVTSRHIVTGSRRIRVTFADGAIRTARVQVEDEDHDLAVLKVSAAAPLKPLPLGPSSDLMVGETVIVVGNPFGYANTVSTGIISALGRSVVMPGGVELNNLIQTNASINPGNSGSPLLNIDGELIGITVAVREGAQGIAFALNADSVQQVLSDHLSTGNMANLAHGLKVHEVVEDGPAFRQQVVVDDTAEESPAARAGFRKGDVLRKLGGRRVMNRFDVERALWNCQPGDGVVATIVRDGKETEVQLKLAASGEPTPVLRRNGKDRAQGHDRKRDTAAGAADQ